MIKTLIGVRLRALLGSTLGKKGKNGKAGSGNKALVLLLLLFLAGIFAFYFFLMAFGMASVMLPLGLDALYFSIFMICAFSIVFVLSIFETKSELFECKDNELLLSMPIKPRHIVIARIFTVMIYNLAETAIVMVPAVIAYAFFGGSVFGIIGGLLLIFFLPLLATALASGVGYLVALIMKRMKRNSLFTVIVSLFFFAAYFVGYTYLVNGMTALEDPSTDFSALADSFGFAGKIGKAALLDPLWALGVMGLCVLVSTAAYLLISANYIPIVTDVRGGKKREYKAKSLKSSKPFAALTKKELKKFLTSPTYILNGGIGLLFAVALGVFALVKKEVLLSLKAELSALGVGAIDLSGLFFALLAIVLSAFFAFIIISSAALSLEGNSLWIIKSMPISAKTVLLAKTMPHIIVSLPTVLVTSVLLIIATEAPPVYCAFIILCPSLISFLGAFLGMFLNVSFPKFEFDNEAQPIKQSASATITMFALMFYALIFGGGAAVLAFLVSPLLALVAFSGVTLALATLFFALLVTVGVRKYDRFCV